MSSRQQLSDIPHGKVRRKDRQVLDETWIEKFLEQAPWGVLAFVRDAQPLVNTNIFYYSRERNAVYLHMANQGQTSAAFEAPSKICFSVSEMGRLLPAPAARNFSTEYAGVTIHGVAEKVTDELEKTDALQKLLQKYAPHLKAGRDYRAITKLERDSTFVLRIAVDEWTGKLKKAEADTPGAYWYPQSGEFHRIGANERESV